MAKKRVIKRKKLKVSSLLILLLILLVISFFGVFLARSRIKNIVISGNQYLSDEEIMETANLTDYPSFFFTFSNTISKKIKKLPIVKNVKTYKGLHNTLFIEIKEYHVLLKRQEKYILNNEKEISLDKNLRVPRLLNDVPKKKYKSLITNLNTVKKDVLGKISEIEYTPNTYDKDRFLLYMDDDNSVYLTLTKFEMINYYDRVLAQLEGRRGFLYLDSGNHFKIME